MDMQSSRVIFIIGVNGVGKSSIIPFLKEKLDSNTFEIHDFDERGVPDNADKDWRQSETKHWLNIGKKNLNNNTSTIVCGFIKPEEVKNATQESNIDSITILLDIDEVSLTSRILSRYETSESLVELLRTTGKTPEKFIQDNVWVSKKFREDSKRLDFYIVETSSLSPESVCNQVVQLLINQ
jgi:predicted ATPase